MKVIPYIFVEECEKALEFYQSIFGGEITHVQKTEGSNKLIHGRLELDTHYALYLSDIFDSVNVGDNVSIAYEFDALNDLEKAYKALSVKGKVKMELQNTFWGATFAMVTDQFNVLWQLSYEK